MCKNLMVYIYITNKYNNKIMYNMWGGGEKRLMGKGQ